MFTLDYITLKAFYLENKDFFTNARLQKIQQPNRREFIQEKMRKIALQNNTMWMLTAGFATPVMSALICNQTEPYLAKWLNKKQNENADKILTNLDEYATKYPEKIKAFHKENGGEFTTRNYGLERATGEYVTFSSIISTLLMIVIYLLIKKIKYSKSKKTNQQYNQNVKIGFYLAISNIIYFIYVR